MLLKNKAYGRFYLHILLVYAPVPYYYINILKNDYWLVIIIVPTNAYEYFINNFLIILCQFHLSVNSDLNMTTLKSASVI